MSSVKLSLHAYNPLSGLVCSFAVALMGCIDMCAVRSVGVGVQWMWLDDDPFRSMETPKKPCVNPSSVQS